MITEYTMPIPYSAEFLNAELKRRVPGVYEPANSWTSAVKAFEELTGGQIVQAEKADNKSSWRIRIRVGETEAVSVVSSPYTPAHLLAYWTFLFKTTEY